MTASVQTCRVCGLWPAQTTDLLCDMCAGDVDRIDRVEQAYRSVRATTRRWEEGHMTAEQAMRYIAAVERMRPR